MGNSSCFGKKEKAKDDTELKEKLIPDAPKCEYFCVNSMSSERLRKNGAVDQTSCIFLNEQQIKEVLYYVEVYYRKESQLLTLPVTNTDRARFAEFLTKGWESMITYRHLHSCSVMANENNNINTQKENLINILELWANTILLVHTKYIFNPNSTMRPKKRSVFNQAPSYISHTPVRATTNTQRVQPLNISTNSFKAYPTKEMILG